MLIVIINAAISVDGKICTRKGESKISSFSDLKRVHKLRCHVDGILVGISTIISGIEQSILMCRQVYI